MYAGYHAAMPTKRDTSRTASELRLVLGQLLRRLRAEHRFPLAHGSVLGRLDREGPQSVSDLALAERVRPQSMAQTVKDLESDGLVRRRSDPADGRRALVEFTEKGRAALEEDRSHRAGWLASQIDELTPDEQVVIARATEIFRQMAQSEG
jgi:DNA-binding MarR family transcriptional regulator